MNLIRGIVENYIRYWKNRSEDLSKLFAQLDGNEDITDRTNWNGHVTASALVLDVAWRKILLIQSKKFNKLLLPGGHLDRGEAPGEAARRELYEETGFSEIEHIEFSLGALFPIEINVHSIGRSESRNEPEHLHYDFVYLFRSHGSNCVLSLKPDPSEAVSVQWYEPCELKASYFLSYERVGRILGA